MSWMQVMDTSNNLMGEGEKAEASLAATHSSASFQREWKVFSGIRWILLSISNLERRCKMKSYSEPQGEGEKRKESLQSFKLAAGL